MHDHYGSLVLRDACQRVSLHRFEHRGMRHFLAIAQAIEGPQIFWLGQLVRQRSARMLVHQIERLHQPRGAPGVAQPRLAEQLLTQAHFANVLHRLHAETPDEEGPAPPYIRTLPKYRSNHEATANVSEQIANATSAAPTLTLTPLARPASGP